jgi:ABC-2 type transport system permease protein
MRRTLLVTRKEFLELRQNIRLIPVILVAPIIQLLLLGYAASTDVRLVPIVIADADRSAPSRALVARFEASPSFSIIASVTTTAEVDRFIERGAAKLAIAIPSGYGSDVDAGRPAVTQVLADGSDSNSTTVALGYATRLIAGHAEELAAGRTTGAPAAGEIDAEVRVWFNPGLESRLFMVPGVLALLLLTVTSNLSSMGIVREKEIGTLEQLNVTPLRRSELIAGKLLPYAVIGLLDAALVIAVAVLWFEIPLRGSLTLLFGLSLCYLLSTLGLGLFISTVSSTQQQALLTTVFFFLVPMIYLSGFVFPIENMPDVIQPVTYLIPLRYFLVAIRGIFLKGVGLDVLWREALALVTIGLAILGLSVARLRKRAA